MQKNNHDCFLTSRVIFNFYNFLDSQIYFTIIIRSSFTSFAKTEINSWRKRNWLSVEEKKTGRLFYDGIIHGNSLLCSESSCSREISAPFLCTSILRLRHLLLFKSKLKKSFISTRKKSLFFWVDIFPKLLLNVFRQ
jgi:hypothetical protein